ncbi:MAG: PAS domain-containing protein [Parvibaculaceae bacterium]
MVSIHEDTQCLLKYWLSLNEGRLPVFSRWDPIEIPRIMPFVMILERGEDRHYFHRFSGTGLCELAGMELTGRPLSDVVDAEDLPQAEASLDAILDGPCGLLSNRTTRSSTGRIIDGEYLSLPLAGKDGAADRIVVHLAVLKTLGYGDESVDIGEQTLVSVIDLGGQMPTFSDGITPSQLLECSSAALS